MPLSRFREHFKWLFYSRFVWETLDWLTNAFVKKVNITSPSWNDKIVCLQEMRNPYKFSDKKSHNYRGIYQNDIHDSLKKAKEYRDALCV